MSNNEEKTATWLLFILILIIIAVAVYFGYQYLNRCDVELFGACIQF